MNKEFHYNAVRVVAQLAGFPSEDAQTIAYASQYVDDASEHEPFTIEGLPMDWVYPDRITTIKGRPAIDPTCTAHSAQRWQKQLRKWCKFYLKQDVQRKVLMSFHFLPSRAKDGEEGFQFVTEADGPLARELMEQAIGSYRTATKEEERRFGLVKLGLALHTFADTFAHSGFSGRHSSQDNDVKGVRTQKRGTSRWGRPQMLGSIVSYAAPDVGHAEVMSLPDQSHRIWKAKYAASRRQPRKIEPRDNAVRFLQAAERIHSLLRPIAPQGGLDWVDFRDALQACFEDRSNWRASFCHHGIGFSYNRFEWRELALDGDSVEWDDYDEKSDFKRLNLHYTDGDLRWFHFHRAAFQQRLLVLKAIPKSW